LFQGSRKYPELAVLIPARPHDAPDCHFCKGTGREPMSEQLKLENIVCYCGGLGWLPPSESRSR
jgi:hypothetical protein